MEENLGELAKPPKPKYLVTSLDKTIKINVNTPTHTFNGLFSRTTWVSRHQKVKSFWILER